MANVVFIEVMYVVFAPNGNSTNCTKWTRPIYCGNFSAVIFSNPKRSKVVFR